MASAKPFPVAFAVLLFVLSGPLVITHAESETEPAPELSNEPVAAAADPSFLQLPALDVEWVKAFNKSVRVGDPLELKVVNAPESAQSVAHPESPDALQEQGWEVLPPENPSGKAAPGEVFFVATPIKKGTLTIPSLAIRDASGKPVARTNPFSLAVVSAIAADDPHPDKPADIRPPETLAFPWWIAGAAGAVFLLLGAVVFFLYRRIKRAKSGPAPVAPAKPVASEDEEAYEALIELEKRGLLLQGRFKPHYFRVSEILKHYLGRRYSFDASESTSSELIRHLTEQERAATVKLIEELFRRLDLVKFTDHVPTPQEAETLVGEARQLIRQTARPAPIFQPPPGAGKPGHAV